mmetsp:Transcript_62066/g.134684  ORF Transcript_62066/g.134684 Transcript_62066/m.134684 type:complete len:322 (+) Transcript_62066:81-1046(+)
MLAPPSHEANEERLQLRSKNTFLEAVDCSRPQRPSRSVPPAFRPVTCDRVASRELPRVPSSWSDISTGCPLSETSEHSHASSPARDGPAHASFPLRQRKSSAKIDFVMGDPSTFAFVLTKEDLEEGSSGLRALAYGSGEPHRLSALAKAWSPKTGAAASGENPVRAVPRASCGGGPRNSLAPGVPRSIRKQQEDVVASTCMALERAKCVIAVENTHIPLGWTLKASLSQQDLHQRERLLTLAKESSLWAAKQTTGVYIVGFCNRPFTEKPHGFTFTLCGVADQAQACWDSLQWGACKRPGRCRWKHPDCKRTVNVVVSLAE